MEGGGVRIEGGRNLTWWHFILLVLVYAAIIQIGGRVIGADVDTDEGMETAGHLVEAMVIPIALSSVFVSGIATWLGWWPQIIYEPLRPRYRAGADRRDRGRARAAAKLSRAPMRQLHWHR